MAIYASSFGSYNQIVIKLADILNPLGEFLSAMNSDPDEGHGDKVQGQICKIGHLHL